MTAIKPITTSTEFEEYHSTKDFQDYVKKHSTTDEELSKLSRAGFGKLVLNAGPRTGYAWRRYLNTDGILKYRKERLDVDGFKMLVEQTEKAERGFIIDLWKYQEELLAVTDSTATTSEAAATTTEGKALEDTAHEGGFEKLAKELHSLGERLPLGNERMFAEMAALREKIDLLTTAAERAETEGAERTTETTAAAAALGHERVTLVKLDSQLPTLKAARGENVGECFSY